MQAYACSAVWVCSAITAALHNTASLSAVTILDDFHEGKARNAGIITDSLIPPQLSATKMSVDTL
jgi:hypothetical protein